EGAQGNNVTLNGTTINAQGNKSSSNASTAIFAQKGSVLNGFNGDATDNITLAGSNIINGRIETILIAQENKGTHTVNLNIKDGSVDALAVKDSTVNITKATVNTGTFASQNGTLIVDASSENTLDISGKASGDLRVYSAGSLDLINEQTAFISTGKDSTLKATGTTEGGLYQYDLTQGADGNFYFVKNTHKASNASSVIQAMAAAPANVANLQADTLSARQDAVRLSENDKGGVWIQYFGGKQKHTTAGNASYDLDVNGVMLGGDTRFMTEDGSWLAGVAMSSA
ncbi:TPA: autotransporter outer membrane beta-barrel domain-containing protein, partial [Escherichia coli]